MEAASDRDHRTRRMRANARRPLPETGEVDTNAIPLWKRNRSALVPPVRAITIPGPVRVGAAGVAPVGWAERRAAEPLAKRADVVAAGVSAVIVPAA
jgi:hypothetical protein